MAGRDLKGSGADSEVYGTVHGVHVARGGIVGETGEVAEALISGAEGRVA